MNIQDFYDELLSQVYTYQSDAPFFICGDFNGRVGHNTDFVEGIDKIPERNVVDHVSNNQGDSLLEFLLSSNCCLLNGRNWNTNDYTCIKPGIGMSVVDYCIVPHEYLMDYTEFNVTRALDLFENSNCRSLVEPNTKLPDHSILHWSMTLPGNNVTDAGNKTSQTREWKRFDLSSIPQTFLSDNDSSSKIRETLIRIDNPNVAQNDLDKCYEDFVETVMNTLESEVPFRVIKTNGHQHSGRHTRKSWWNEELSQLWNNVVKCERAWSKSKQPEKRHYKEQLKSAQKLFDRTVQRTKRQHWKKEQEKLLNLQNYDQKELWKKIGTLGIAQERKKRIPMEVILANGEIERDENVILEKWKNDFKSLLNPAEVNNTDLPEMTHIVPAENDADMSRAITREEIISALSRAKDGKSPGLDGLPTECLRNNTSVTYMLALFNKCFESGSVPGMWKKSIINPIPKDGALDKRCPLNYRGITLASTMYKLYCSILNDRLTDWVDLNNKIVDVQNGFRKDRSCIDHVLSHALLIQTSKTQKKDLYAAYIDFSKAFDRINRDFLFSKLAKLGIGGSMLSALKSLYSDVSCCVRINNVCTEFFDILCGVKRGCILSPLIFSLYINDCIERINALNKGVSLDNGERVSVLAYADDLVIIAEKEQDLQDQLDVLSEWCTNWGLLLNKDKSKIVHYRNPSVPRSQFEFKCMDNPIDFTEKYKYLGLWFNENMDMAFMASEVAKSAHRALGLIVAKVKAAGGVPLDLYTKLYDACVQPIIDYGAAVWDQKSYSSISAVQHRAMRFFLGVNKSTPVAALQGELAWKSPEERQWKCVTRQWCRLRNMDSSRITKRVFTWASRQASRNWIRNTKSQFIKLNLNHLADHSQPHNRSVALSSVAEGMRDLAIIDWRQRLNRESAIRGTGSNKLRTYRLFKQDYEREPYLMKIMPWRHRRALAQFRCGTAPLRVETGRYEGLALNQRLCYCCETETEDELHVITKCPAYDDLRMDLYNKCAELSIDFITFTDIQKMCFILSNESVSKTSSRILYNILLKRRSTIYQ